MRPVLPLLLVCAASAHAAGDDEPDQAGLESLLGETVGTSASRTAESTHEAPGTTWSISGTDLKRFGIQSVEEAIRYLGHGMTSFETDLRLNNSFSARGYQSNNLGLHLAVLIDGNQAGGSSKTARSSQQYLMPIELVDHIEIVLGPGSVVYGNSAMLGVINVVTRSAASVGSGGVVVQGSLGFPGDRWAKDLSWGEAWARGAVWGTTTFQLGGDPFELVWHAAVRWDRQQGRSMWRLAADADPFDDPLSAHAREDVFNRTLGGRLFARATWGRWAFRGWVAAGGGEGTAAIVGTGASRNFEAEYGLDALWTKPVSDRGEVSLRLYGVLYDTRAVTDPFEPDAAACVAAVGTSRCYDTLSYWSFRPYIEPLFKWDWQQTGAHVTTVGAQVFMDGSFITTGKAASDAPAAQGNKPTIAPLPNGAVYAQHIWRGRWGSLNGGLRADVGLLGWSISPRLAVAKTLWRDATLKAVFATGFRTPAITERFLEIKGFLAPNAALRPEQVYSAELGLAQRLKLQTLQVSLFATRWEGVISPRSINMGGTMVAQFANLRSVWSAGVNLGWQGAQGPLDWGLSLNYAPGRVRLPADIAQYSDAQLAETRITRQAIAQYGTQGLGGVFMPVDGYPDFYATGHLSFSLGEGAPRVSIAANLNSPRIRGGYGASEPTTDPRNVDGAWLPWALDVRSVVELPLSPRATFRLSVTARTLSFTGPAAPRVGSANAPAPGGGVGAAPNPVAPASAMAELNVRL